MEEVAIERWDLQKDSDSLERVVVADLLGQQSQVEARKACEVLG